MEKAIKAWLKQLKLNESTISMILGGLVVVVVGVLIYNYFKSVGKQPGGEGLVGTGASEELGMPKGLPTSHTVVAGEHLWQIAEKYYGSGYNWVDIAAANKLRNPNQLLVGQPLEIPQVAVKTLTTKAEAKAASVVVTGTSYTVQQGDTLWSIAVRTYQDGYKWPEIAKANTDKIANPDKIEVGLVLTLPR